MDPSLCELPSLRATRYTRPVMEFSVTQWAPLTSIMTYLLSDMVSTRLALSNGWSATRGAPSGATRATSRSAKASSIFRLSLTVAELLPKKSGHLKNGKTFPSQKSLTPATIRPSTHFRSPNSQETLSILPSTLKSSLLTLRTDHAVNPRATEPKVERS